MAEFEREMIRERTRAGVAAARARGRQGNRPKTLDSAQKVALAQALNDHGRHSIAEIYQTVGISRATFSRLITTREPARSPP